MKPRWMLAIALHCRTRAVFAQRTGGAMKKVGGIVDTCLCVSSARFAAHLSDLLTKFSTTLANCVRWWKDARQHARKFNSENVWFIAYIHAANIDACSGMMWPLETDI